MIVSQPFSHAHCTQPLNLPRSSHDRHLRGVLLRAQLELELSTEADRFVSDMKVCEKCFCWYPDCVI